MISDAITKANLFFITFYLDTNFFILTSVNIPKNTIHTTPTVFGIAGLISVGSGFSKHK